MSLEGKPLVRSQVSKFLSCNMYTKVSKIDDKNAKKHAVVWCTHSTTSYWRPDRIISGVVSMCRSRGSKADLDQGTSLQWEETVLKPQKRDTHLFSPPNYLLLYLSPQRCWNLLKRYLLLKWRGEDNSCIDRSQENFVKEQSSCIKVVLVIDRNLYILIRNEVSIEAWMYSITHIL